jgi:hypothetical protein
LPEAVWSGTVMLQKTESDPSAYRRTR